MNESARKLSEIYGFRNRFWRKSYRKLLPEMKRIRRELITESLEPLAKAASHAVSFETEEVRRQEFNLKLAEAWNRKRILGPVRLKGGQKIVYKNAISIVNLDGSVDLERLKSIQQVIKLTEQSVLMHKGSSIGSEDLVSLLEQAAMRVTDENIDVIESILNSSAGRIIGGIIPGFPLLVTIAGQFDRIQRGEFSDLWRELIAESTKRAGRFGLKRGLDLLRASAAVTPVSVLLDVGVDRVTLQDALAARLKQRTETLKSLTQKV